MMKRILYTILLVCVSQLLVSCGEPTFDAADPDVSTVKMMEEMTDDEKTAFKRAIMRIALDAASEGKSLSDMQNMLDGKTAEEIIEMSK